MIKYLYEKAEEVAKDKNLTLQEAVEIEKLNNKQNEFLKTNFGKIINGTMDIGIKIVMPDFVENEIIAVKDSLLEEGFSAAVDTAIEEATNLGKSAMGIITGTFENISQIKKAIKKGGLIDSLADVLDKTIDLAKKGGKIKSKTATALKNGKKSIIKTIKSNIDDELENQVEIIEKIDGYITKWYQYYEQKNLPNMEYQYNKIQECLSQVFPLESTINKARTVENLHELIKNNDREKRFELTEEEKELAKMLNK